MVQGVGTSEGLEDAEVTRLDELAGNLNEGFKGKLRYSAKFPSQGWVEAKKWGGSLETDLKREAPMTIKQEDIPSTSRLRDALNAAWYCRLQRHKLDRPEEVAMIAEAAHDLCDDILKARREAKRRDSGLSISLPSPSESHR